MFTKGHLVVFKSGKDSCIYTIDEIKTNMIVLKNIINSSRINVNEDQIREVDDLEILLGRRTQK